jgi:CMP/dCMP kinase
MVIALDGPAGSGKSSTAGEVARRLGILYLDTGAMYRAVTLKCLREEIGADDNDALGELLSRTRIAFEGVPPTVRVLLDGEDVSREIRGDEVTRRVSEFCAPVVVREAMVAQQREIAGDRSLVCEGRDIGTVVFPSAELKFFVIASVQERARRRKKDFERLGIEKTLKELEAEIEKRDRKDSTRANSPLKKADDAMVLDTTEMTLERQIELICGKAREHGLNTI